MTLKVTNFSVWVFRVKSGIYLDGAGREVAKLVSLSQEGFRIGTPQELKFVAVFFTAMLIIAIWVIIYSLWFLVGQTG